MDLTELVLSLLISAIITVLVYMFVPLIIIISRKKFRKKTIKLIIIFNGLGGFLLFTVIYALLGNESGASVWVAILWSTIANFILKKTSCFETEEANTEDIDTSDETKKSVKENDILFCRKCGEKLIDGSQFCRKCGTRIIETPIFQEEKIGEIEFCKKCGADVSNDTDSCHVCGEQIIKKKNINSL